MKNFKKSNELIKINKLWIVKQLWTNLLNIQWCIFKITLQLKRIKWNFQKLIKRWILKMFLKQLKLM